MRKLAKPKMKKVGTSFCGITGPTQIWMSAVPAHESIIIQKNRSEIRSVIT